MRQPLIPQLSASTLQYRASGAIGKTSFVSQREVLTTRCDWHACFRHRVAREAIEAIIDGRLEVIRGGAVRKEMVKLNRNDPIAIDDVLRPMRASMEEASRNHSAL
jgi:hypothetical protein